MKKKKPISLFEATETLFKEIDKLKELMQKDTKRIIRTLVFIYITALLITLIAFVIMN